MAELKKVLGFPAILLITINSILGTGIFFLPAVGAGISGPASIISWLILAIISIYIAMCFAELSSMFAKAGGIYEFCKQAYGRFLSFIIGWMTVVAGNITIAMLVVGAIQYLVPVGSPLLKIGISLMFIFAFNFIAFKGMQTSAVMLIVFALITLGTLFALIIPSLFKFHPSNFTPFFVAPGSALLVTIFLIAETFFGWETATFLAEETKDGQRVMPKALIWGTVIIAIVAVLFVVSSLGVINWATFGASATPLADLGIIHYGILGGNIFTILVYVAIIGSVAGWIVSAPRLLLAMAKDKLFLTRFAKIHPKNMTPHMAILFQTVLTTILVIVGAGSYETMLHLLVPIVLVAYSFVLISVVVLRFKMPNVKRYFKVPFGKIGPIIVTLFLLGLIGMWAFHTSGAWQVLQLAIAFLFLGVPLYFLIEMYYDSPAIIKVNEKLSFILGFFQNFFFSPLMQKMVFNTLGNLKNKTVLEYGCSLGLLTKKLAKKVLPNGKVYVCDYVLRNVTVTAKLVKKHKHVKVFHHPYLHHFKPKVKVPKVDAIVSTGILSNIQKPQIVLNHLGNNVKKGGKVVFIDYGNFFFVIPNAPWLRNKKRVVKIFRKAGFDISIKKKQSIFWQYLIIEGIKK